jgi:hypothetical protein
MREENAMADSGHDLIPGSRDIESTTQRWERSSEKMDVIDPNPNRTFAERPHQYIRCYL